MPVPAIQQWLETSKQVKNSLYPFSCHHIAFVYGLNYQFKPCSSERSAGIFFLNYYLKKCVYEQVSISPLTLEHTLWVRFLWAL